MHKTLTFNALQQLVKDGAAVVAYTGNTNGAVAWGFRIQVNAEPNAIIYYQGAAVYPQAQAACEAGEAALLSLQRLPLTKLREDLLRPLALQTQGWLRRSAPGLQAASLLATANIWPLAERYLTQG